MARRADGRVNSTDRTKRYTPDTFEDGSAVRRLAAQLPRDLRHDADAHHGAVQILGLIGDEQPLHDEQHEQHDDEHCANEAQFLAHHAENKVVGAFRQPELLFHAVA